jgi:hypothetical protein
MSTWIEVVAHIDLRQRTDTISVRTGSRRPKRWGGSSIRLARGRLVMGDDGVGRRGERRVRMRMRVRDREFRAFVIGVRSTWLRLRFHGRGSRARRRRTARHGFKTLARNPSNPTSPPQSWTAYTVTESACHFSIVRIFKLRKFKS